MTSDSRNMMMIQRNPATGKRPGREVQSSPGTCTVNQSSTNQIQHGSPTIETKAALKGQTCPARGGSQVLQSATSSADLYVFLVGDAALVWMIAEVTVRSRG
jgi:hypothetical protein